MSSYGIASTRALRRRRARCAVRADLLVAAGQRSAGFDLLLVGHVLTAVVGFGAVAVSGVQAARLRRAGATGASAALRRYFAPGTNWAGRVLYGVPLFGFALLADSSGRFDADDPWVVVGILLWALSAVAAEGWLWPAERRLQHAVVTGPGPAFGRDCLTVALLSWLLGAAFLAATVVMVAKPG